MNSKYQQEKQIYHFCRYQVVWCSKYRRKVLVNNIRTRLEELVTLICKENHINLLQTEIKEEYIRIQISVIPQIGIHKAVKLIKARTSQVLRKEFPELTTKMPTLWTNSYLVSTEDEIPKEDIEAYIREQKTSQRQ